jgi:hypothetical protein
MPGGLDSTPTRSFSSRARAAARAARTWAAENWVFLLVVGAGIALRVLTMVAYEPSLPLRSGDAYQYLRRAITLSLGTSYHPFVYSAMLKPLILTGTLTWVTAAQHLAGLAVGVMLYLALRRFGLHPAVAALGAAPVMLDGYQLALEHQPLTETFFELLTVGAVVLAAWSGQPRLASAAAVGFLLGASVLIRFAGLAILPAIIAFWLVRRVRWTRLVALVAVFLIPLVGYALWFQSQTGSFALTNRNGFYLYGRVAAFADCKTVDVPAAERIFCPENLEHPPGRGLFNSGLPYSVRSDPKNNALASSFSRRMIRAKPGAFAEAVITDFGRYFVTRANQDDERWLMPDALSPRDEQHVPRGIDLEFRLRSQPASVLRAWQENVWLYGPLLGACLLVGLVGGIAGWARANRPPVGPEALLFTFAAVGVLLFPTIFAVYHFRYYVPAIPFAGPAAALGASVLYHRLRRARSDGLRS